MKRKIGAILLAVATLFVLNSPGASAGSNTMYCDTPSGVTNDQVHQSWWTYYTDGGGFQRVRWDREVINNLTTEGNGTEYRLSFQSDTGTAFETGAVSTSARYIDYGIPSAANARTIYHPFIWIESGANSDGYARCYTFVNL